MQWLKDYLNSFWTTAYNFLLWLVESFFFLCFWLLKGIAEVIGWVVYTIFDGFLVVIHGFFSALDLSALAFSHAAAWSSLPAQVVWFVDQIGIAQCFTMLAAAFSIRLLLNLIPGTFTRV